MSRTYHHGLRGREKKFGVEYWTGSLTAWDDSGNRVLCTRRMKWPDQIDYITAAILGEKILATPPKRKKWTWHYEWMMGSRGSRNRSKSAWVRLYIRRPERALTRALLRRVLHLTDLEASPIFPQGRKPHVYYW